jgi:hypothetical protein
MDFEPQDRRPQEKLSEAQTKTLPSRSDVLRPAASRLRQTAAGLQTELSSEEGKKGKIKSD